MTFRNKIAYIFDYVHPTWSHKRLYDETLKNNHPWDEDLSKRIRKMQKRYDKQEYEKMQKRHKKANKLMKKGKTGQAIDVLLDKK